MKVVGIDPGGATGYAIFELPSETWTIGAITGEDHHLKLWHFLEVELLYFVDVARKAPYMDARVVCESFNNDANPAAVLVSLQYIGVVKLFCQTYDIPLFMSNRSNKDVNYLKGNQLKRFSVWSTSKDARDAARHLIHYMIHHVGYEPLLLEWKKNG